MTIIIFIIFRKRAIQESFENISDHQVDQILQGNLVRRGVYRRGGVRNRKSFAFFLLFMLRFYAAIRPCLLAFELTLALAPVPTF